MVAGKSSVVHVDETFDGQIIWTFDSKGVQISFLVCFKRLGCLFLMFSLDYFLTFS